MKRIIVSISIITMMLTSSCEQKEKADLVIINGKVLTINQENLLLVLFLRSGHTLTKAKLKL